MNLIKVTRWVAVVGVAASLGCKSLDVENPNSPDATRAFADPGAIAGLVTGAWKSWFNAHTEFNSALVLNSMADGISASWNNWNMRYYTSEGSDCPVRCGWDNNPSSAFRFQVETYWYGYAGTLSSANDVLTAIRTNKIIITSPENTKILEAAAVMLQAMVFAQIALNYDQGFVVTEATDISTPAKVAALQFTPRAGMRDAAIAKFNEAATLFAAISGNLPREWFGKASQPQYTAAQMVKVIRTMQAEALAFYPRNAAEAGQVNWAQVATFAAGGISNFEFGFFHDATEFYDGVKQWGNDLTTTRLDTRVARLITDGPDASKRHLDPWPDPAGNPQPNAFDQRVGNGTWGPDCGSPDPDKKVRGQPGFCSTGFLGAGTKQADAGAGTDYAYAASAIFRPARGQYHQSNLASIRYTALVYPGYGLPEDDGTGFAPQYTPTYNDLLWAEGLIRGGGNAGQAATLINNSRVGRGGLTPVSGASSQAELLAALRYEQDIELVSFGAAPFYNRRKIDGLKSGTPRQMPVPAKELQVLLRELYSFGGAGKPDMAPGMEDGPRVRSARDIWNEISSYSKQQARSRRFQ